MNVLIYHINNSILCEFFYLNRIESFINLYLKSILSELRRDCEHLLFY